MNQSRQLRQLTPVALAVLAAFSALTLVGCAGEPSSIETASPDARSASADPVVASSVPGSGLGTTIAGGRTTPDIVVVVTDPPGVGGTSSKQPAESNLFGGDDPEDSLMPDLICLDLQSAQDEIQDHGVFFSRSVDASGAGRRQIRDSNWVVVAQQPPAGSPIGEGDAVLSVVKRGEGDACSS